MSGQPTIFKFRHKHERGFHYIDNNGEPKDVKIDINLPVEIRISPQFKIKKKPNKLSGTIVVLSPISGEEITIDWKKALQERVEMGR